MVHPFAPLGACTAGVALLLVSAGCGDEPEASPAGKVDVSRPASIAAPPAEVPPRVLIVGMDGADLRNIRALRAQGRLPNFGKMMDEGLTAPLGTVANASPIIWTSVATGVMPEKHGIEFFRDEENRPAASTMRKRPALWNILSHYDKTVGILGWWATFPAEDVLGYLVSPYTLLMPPIGTRTRVGAVGDPADLRRSYPVELAHELEPLMYWEKDLALEPIEHLYADPKRTTITRQVLAKDWSYYAIALRQLREEPVDLVAVYFQGIDACSHDWDRWVMGRNVNEVRDPKVSPEEVEAADARVAAMYDYNDEILGGLLSHTSAETDVIVLSDHGWNYDGTSHWELLPGTFLARGPSFVKGEFEGDLSVIDVTPIVLALLGVPLSPAFDGKVPEGILRDDLMAGIEYLDDDYPIQAVAADEVASPEYNKAMIERLEALGYIDADGNDTQGARKRDGHEQSK